MHLTVIGDVMLDQYLHAGRCKENPETQGRAFIVDRVEYRLGGAGAVAAIARSLGAEVSLCGVVGRDYEGDKVRCLSSPLRTTLVSDRDITTVKTRTVLDGKLQPDRWDREDVHPISRSCAEEFASREADLTIVQDYGKGVITPYLLSQIRGRTLVDPARGRPWSDYGCASLIKANRVEACLQTGCEMAGEACLSAYLATGIDIVVTDGERGMYYATQGVLGYVPAVPVECMDPCGAGDTVIAVLAVSLSEGLELRDACQRAAEVASRQVQWIGVRATPQSSLPESPAALPASLPSP